MDRFTLEDGHQLSQGLVVSRAGGFSVAVYRCTCGREQTAKCDGFPGGISTKIAEFVGWRQINGQWSCPFCTGNEENLKKVFGNEPDK